jgi:hypothetical protein
VSAKIKKTIILSATSRRRRAIALAGVIFALVAVIGHLPQNWTNPIPESAQKAAAAAIQKGERAQTGVSDSLSADNLAKQQQAARHSVELTKLATSEDTYSSTKATNVARKGFKYAFLFIPLIALLWFFMRKKNKVSLGETLIFSTLLILAAAFPAEIAKYSQYPVRYIAYGTTCGWSDVCSKDKLVEQTNDQTVTRAYIDTMYSKEQLQGETSPWDVNSAEEHTQKVLSGQPFSATEHEYYLKHSTEMPEGKRTLTARTARYFTAIRNSVINLFGYTSIATGLTSSLAGLLLIPLFAMTWVMPKREKRRKTLNLIAKSAVLLHVAFFVSLAVFFCFSWVSVLILKSVEILGIAGWPISLMLIVPLCWATYYQVVKFAKWSNKKIRPPKTMRVR